jgi:uncharacterized protein
MSTDASAISPVAAADRIQTLDVLRGFALLGILIMNIQSYCMPEAAYFFPTAHGDLNGANYWVWYLSELFARRKFITLFSMLFGAGVVLMHERASAGGRGWAGLHYRRMGVLWLIGMLHAYLLWEGDILVSYAICGLFLFVFRRVRPGRLLVVGLIFLAVGFGLSLMAGLSAPYWPPERLAEFRSQWQPGEELIAQQIASMRGGWLGEIVHRAPNVLMIHLFYIPYHNIWRAGGCMLLGMAFFKWGWLSGLGRRRLYGTLIALGLLVGLPLTVLGVHLQMKADWEPVYSFFIASQFGYWGAIPLSLGYLGLVVLLFRGRIWPALAERLAAVGRMAFTNYLLQTVICTTLVYGRGFGLFGGVERTGQAGIVLVVWILQLLYSPIWLRHFLFGPAEWLWRSLSYRKRQPMRRLT